MLLSNLRHPCNGIEASNFDTLAKLSRAYGPTAFKFELALRLRAPKAFYLLLDTMEALRKVDCADQAAARNK